jgi:ribosome-associated protein
VAKAKKTVAKKTASKGKKQASKAKPVAKKYFKAKPAKKSTAKKTPAKKATAKPAAKITKPVNRRPAGVPEQLRDAALKILDERQAEEIVTFDLAGRSSFADYLIVASGRASRQLAAIAHYLGEAFEKLGAPRVRIEGLPEANWVLVDGGDVIVHLFMPEVRGFYNLEGIWNKRG